MLVAITCPHASITARPWPGLLPRVLRCSACGRSNWIAAPTDRSRKARRERDERERARWAAYDPIYADMK